MQPITPESLGLNPITAMGVRDPRWLYEVTAEGAHLLREFFGVELARPAERILLTPAIVQDLTIFYAFFRADYRFVHIDRDACAAFDSEQDARRLSRQQESVLINPRFVPLH